MQITEARLHEYDFSVLSAAMARTDVEGNLSLNPCLPQITGETMHWPVLCLLFMVNDQPLAWFAALHTDKEWFSLPHYNNGAYWFNTSAFNAGFSGEAMDERLFFSSFISNQSWFTQKPTQNRLLLIALEPADMENRQAGIAPGLHLRQRSFYKLEEHRLSHKVDSHLALQGDEKDQFSAFSPGVRRKIRKADRNGISIQTGGIELLDTFYKVYRRNIHQLGSFGLPKSFFQDLLRQYTDGDAKLFIATLNGEAVGSSLLLTWHHYAENPWFATLRAHNRQYVSYLLHWHMIKASLAAACRIYSMGYSTADSGVHRYKQQWGTTDKTIYLNSTFPVADRLQKMQYLRKIIRRMPQSWISIFDRYIATRFY